MADFGSGVEVRATTTGRYADILTPEAVAFAVALERQFRERRWELLQQREQRQDELDSGATPDFLAETQAIREGTWRVAPLPPDLLDRRVEITGPPDRKMVLNALNSGAKIFMADFEDSLTPTWANLLDGQLNLRDAVRRTITFDEPATGKSYRLNDNSATLFVRVRGWHLDEGHIHIDGHLASGSLFDFALFLFHNGRELVNRGTGPYLYLPKLESYLEARLWNDVFTAAEAQLDLAPGAIRATVLIETLPAAFQMDEILWELRDHSAGLNCGRWDYLFSYIKKLAGHQAVLLPDRSQLTMETHFLRSYSRLAIQTCHRRGTCAIGGMSALIPIKNDPVANEFALAGVRDDKEREAKDGHDGAWVAHPSLVPVAMEVFDRLMPGPNQISRQLQDAAVTTEDLLRIPTGAITEAGLQQNVAVGIAYIEAWLRGIGCVPLSHRMEDAATAEICRAQLWQWVHHGATLQDGRPVTADLCDRAIASELARAQTEVDEARYASYQHAAFLMQQLILTPKFKDFLTLPAYQRILADEGAANAAPA